MVKVSLKTEVTKKYYQLIECKGRANESFPMRWKLFKKYVKANMPRVTLYKPQNQKECDTVIELITKSKIK